MTMKRLGVALLSAGLVFGFHGAGAAAAKKNVRAGLTEKQKTELRDRARAWCKKNYAKGGTVYIVRVEILSDGRVRCWTKG